MTSAPITAKFFGKAGIFKFDIDNSKPFEKPIGMFLSEDDSVCFVLFVYPKTSRVAFALPSVTDRFNTDFASVKTDRFHSLKEGIDLVFQCEIGEPTAYPHFFIAAEGFCFRNT